MQGSITGRACRPSCLEFFVVFSETCISAGKHPLERPFMEDISTTGSGPTSGHLALNLQLNAIPDSVAFSNSCFKNYSVFYSSFSVIIKIEEVFLSLFSITSVELSMVSGISLPQHSSLLYA